MKARTSRKRGAKRGGGAATTRLLKQRYELLMGAINEGVYDWNVTDDTIYYSESVKQAVGLPPQLLKTAADWRSRIHPEDLPRYDAAFLALFKARTQRFECDYRYRALDGSWRWARQHGVAVRGADGRVQRVVGATGDITELRQTEQALKQSEERYALATRAATEGIYEWNVETGALFISDRARELFGLPPGALKNTDWNARIHPDDFPRYRTAVIEHFKGRTPGVECEYRARDAAGDYRWVLDRGQAVRGADGRAIRLIGAETDITQRKEALEQQIATAEILKVTSSSPTDVQPVFEAILTNAQRLCEASFAAVFTYDGEFLHNVGRRGASPEFARFLQGMRARPSRETTTRRCALERRTIHTPDLLNDPDFDPPEAQRREDVRTALSVPMIREGVLVGVITLWRAEVRPFTGKQIALVETFADQAVIAVENVRLFNETKEALEQQTAAAEVLKAISGSLTDAQPVFEAILTHASRLCQATVAAVFLYRDGVLVNVAQRDASPEFESYMRASRAKPSPDTTCRRCALERRTIHTADLLNDPRFSPPDAHHAENIRTVLSVPMMREETLIGVLTLWRKEVRPFAAKQIALVETFASQAVIALENVRLFNETREALEQQKALAEVLGTISRSVADARPVFDLILDSCQRLFEGHLVGMTLLGEDGMVRLGAYKGHDKEAMERVYPYPLGRDSGSGQAILDRKVVHFPDVDAPGSQAPRRVLDGSRAVGFKSIIFAPLIGEERELGALWVGRRLPGPFSEREIALLKTFADQAVIAIQNVRMFNETKEALDQQKAAGEVLRAISGSIADAAPVFDKILESCQSLFAGNIVGLNLVGDDGLVRIGAYHGANRDAFEKRFPVPVTREGGTGRAILDRSVLHYPDVEHGADVPEGARGGCQVLGIKSVIFAPMLWEGQGLGAIWVGRYQVSSFSEKDIALLKTFADQAVIAIQNARLFREIREKSAQLEVASRHKSEFLANMSHELRTPLNAIIGFTRIVMRQSKELLPAKQYENLEKILASGQNLLALINAVLDLSKVEAGRIEVQAREVELAPVLEQCLRTIEPLVKVALVRQFDAALPPMYVDEEKLRQVVMNLLSNAAKFTEQGMIWLRAQAANGSVAITVADTGIGIAPDKLELIFEEFEQADAGSTRAYGGTGLGLTIARRLARLMGGDIGVESSPGTGSRFTLTLPARYAS